jgi:DegV family protein with EDD domain
MVVEEIVTTLESEIGQYHLVFFADTLEYLQRGGRIGRASLLVGSLLKIKPLLACEDGVVVPIERTRTRSRAIDGLIGIAADCQPAARIGILHDGQHPDDLARVLDGVRGLVPDGEVYVNQYGPIVATHVGPGALGLCVFRHTA